MSEMRIGRWNRNIHYHDLVLRSVPSGCRHALDMGCGEGILSRQLSRYCRDVTAIDTDEDTLARAIATTGSQASITFLKGDVMTHPFSECSFDFITSVASLHHLPLTSALKRFRSLLKPGGVLAVIGLYRLHTLRDYSSAAVALPTSMVLRCVKGFLEVNAPLREPAETLGDIRRACDSLLPGAMLRRELLFRYSMIWRKPQVSGAENANPETERTK